MIRVDSFPGLNLKTNPATKTLLGRRDIKTKPVYQGIINVSECYVDEGPLLSSSVGQQRVLG